ncbi:MAG TPA: flagellar basal body P-ring formation chaperone FlgA [Fontimonas sp.]
MKFWRLACTFLLLGWLAPALADDEALERIREAAMAAVAAQAPATAQLSADSLDPRLRLPACAEAPVAEPPASLRGSTVTVAVRCNAPSQWTVHVPVRLRDPRTVYVLTRAVRAGETVDDGLFVAQQRDVALLPFGFLDDLEASRGMQFKRALAAGVTPTPADLAAPNWVKRGQLVQVLSRAGGIEVRAEGKALVDGSAGERIRVENRNSRRIVEGRVSAPGVVEVAM